MCMYEHFQRVARARRRVVIAVRRSGEMRGLCSDDDAVYMLNVALCCYTQTWHICIHNTFALEEVSVLNVCVA